MTGRVSVSARATATDGRTGLLTNPDHGFEIPGIDISGLTFLSAIRITNLASGGSPTALNLSTLDVTENGATSTDEGGDWKGRDVSAANIRLIAIVPESSNDESIDIESDVIAGTLQPGGIVFAAMPEGIGGSYLSSPLTFNPGGASQGARVYIWGVAS